MTTEHDIQDLRKTIARLDGEVEHLRLVADSHSAAVREMIGHVDSLRNIVGSGRERHLGSCPGYYFLPNEERELSRQCTCGVDAVMEKTDPDAY